METRHSVEGFSNEFTSISTHCGIMAAWSRKTLKKNILYFLKKDPLRKNFQKSVPKRFIATSIDVLLPNFVKFGLRKSVKWCVIYLTKKYKISHSSSVVATVQIVSKICQGQPQTMYSECSGFHPNRFTFGGVISERVKRARKCIQYSAEAYTSSLIKYSGAVFFGHVRMLKFSKWC